MQRSAMRTKQGKIHGEWVQVAVSMQVPRPSAQMHLNLLLTYKGIGPELVRGITNGLRSRLNVVRPEAQPFLLDCVPELMPKPIHHRHRDHKDEMEYAVIN